MYYAFSLSIQFTDIHALHNYIALKYNDPSTLPKILHYLFTSRIYYWLQANSFNQSEYNCTLSAAIAKELLILFKEQIFHYLHVTSIQQHFLVYFYIYYTLKIQLTKNVQGTMHKTNILS